MSIIQVSSLTFGYEGSRENVFENVSFRIDTDWKLGMIGRNGKGKTTFLRLLMSRFGQRFPEGVPLPGDPEPGQSLPLASLSYQGSISGNIFCDYFPFTVPDAMAGGSFAEILETVRPGLESWRVLAELDELGLEADLLYRPADTLSGGEYTKIMLAALFAEENGYLLIDEPTNHLDAEARDSVRNYLNGKKSFLLVSHDRDLLDAVADHVLVLNRGGIEVQSGNYSSWAENKRRQDAFRQGENDKHLKEIGKLRRAADKTQRWAVKSENTKIGFDPVKEHDRSISTRSYIGAKTKKLESRVKATEQRIQREIEAKEGLLNDIENPADLKLMPLVYHKEKLVQAREFSFRYGDREVLRDLTFTLSRGDRIVVTGRNGSGKTTLIRAILEKAGYAVSAAGAKPRSAFTAPDPASLTGFAGPGTEDFRMNASGIPQAFGVLETGSGLILSYVSQDTSFLTGSVRSFCRKQGINESLFFAVLRQLDLDRSQFTEPMETYSEGQKKKTLLAASLCTPAHLYIWDEPLNYIDIFSREQIEDLILRYRPTMLLVEHDVRFRERIATAEIRLSGTGDGS